MSRSAIWRASPNCMGATTCTRAPGSATTGRTTLRGVIVGVTVGKYSLGSGRMVLVATAEVGSSSSSVASDTRWLSRWPTAGRGSYSSYSSYSSSTRPRYTMVLLKNPDAIASLPYEQRSASTQAHGDGGGPRWVAPSPRPERAFPEQRAPHAHHRGTLGQRHLEVVGHAH